MEDDQFQLNLQIQPHGQNSIIVQNEQNEQNDNVDNVDTVVFHQFSILRRLGNFGYRCNQS